jgi:hypothetical protein
MMGYRSRCNAVMHGSKKCEKEMGNSMRFSDDVVKWRSSAPLTYLIMANPEIG